jgi:hypothetical protein
MPRALGLKPPRISVPAHPTPFAQTSFVCAHINHVTLTSASPCSRFYIYINAAQSPRREAGKESGSFPHKRLPRAFTSFDCILPPAALRYAKPVRCHALACPGALYSFPSLVLLFSFAQFRQPHSIIKYLYSEFQALPICRSSGIRAALCGNFLPPSSPSRPRARSPSAPQR